LFSDEPRETKTVGSNSSGKELAWIPADHALFGDAFGVGARDEPLISIDMIANTSLFPVGIYKI